MTDSTLLFEKLPSFLINKFSKHSSREIDDFKYVIEQQTRHILIELDEYRQTSPKHAYKSWKVIDFFLRRIHEYCIRQVFGPSGTGSFYVDKDWKKGKKFKFEHNIPMAVIGEQLLEGHITLLQAMFPPITLLSLEKDKILNLSKNDTGKKWLVKKTPDIQNFWKRYEHAGIQINGNFRNVITNEDVDSKWNLNDHYKMLEIL